MRQYKQPEMTKEIQQFSSINKHNLPDSRRTILPSYQPENEQEKINHKAFAYFSNKYNSNSVGPDFIPYKNENEDEKIKRKKQSEMNQMLKESTQPKEIRHRKSNILHQKYVETSQINNIPGPDIVKRDISNNNYYEENEKNMFFNNNYYNINNKNSDAESFQRKKYMDYNSNIACLPGSVINANGQKKSMIATDGRRNESHIIFGFENQNNNFNNENLDYKKMYNGDYNYYGNQMYHLKRSTSNNINKIPRPASCSGKRIVRNNKNKDSFGTYQLPYDINNNRMNNFGNNNSKNNNNMSLKEKYSLMKNYSQITFG